MKLKKRWSYTKEPTPFTIQEAIEYQCTVSEENGTIESLRSNIQEIGALLGAAIAALYEGQRLSKPVILEMLTKFEELE